jgi:hypothetical protein
MGNQKEKPLGDTEFRQQPGQTLIEHPESFTDGTRVLMLKSRHKDGIAEERAILRVSHGVDRFRRQMNYLLEIMRPSERIYASAGQRDLKKAIRLFKERQLEADYAGEPEEFYRHIDARWASCLMAPAAQLEKFWVFDCDTPEDSMSVRNEYFADGAKVEPYCYRSKNGEHIVVAPFNRSRLSGPVNALLHDNAIILWAHS